MNDDPLILTDLRPARADAVKNRELLLQTAARLFADQGVDEVTMSMIAQAAGVGKGTLYRHFASKTELCHALLDHDQRELQNRALLRLREKNLPLDDLRWFLEEVAAFVVRNLPLLYVIGDTGAPPTLANQAHLWWRQTVRGLLARAQIAGDLDYLADLFYVLLDPQTIRFQMRNLNYSQARVVDGLLYTLDKLST